MQLNIHNSLAEISISQWDALGNTDYPFTHHAFLHGLEIHHCLKPFGWEPVYFTLTRDNQLIAALPAYIKSNSYGELVFDHSWAQAYEQSGLNYYPKLVSAIPYTPATGNRFLINLQIITQQHEKEQIQQVLLDAVKSFCGQYQLSSWHILFEQYDVLKSLEAEAVLLRRDIQFHWHNRGYNNFDDFLDTLSSRKRKNLKKERLSVHNSDIEIIQKYGDELTEDEWFRVHELYADIFLRKYGTATLTREFFYHLGQYLKQQVIVILALAEDKIVACSLFFCSDTHLYGRVWGCEEFSNHLHFECCYYQGIEYCIKHGLKVFDPGAQGQHKISRGFLPTYTWSGHWIKQPEFQQLIARFLRQEKQFLEVHFDDLLSHSPYKNTTT